MSAHMKKHLTEGKHVHVVRMHYRDNVYVIPWEVAERYRLEPSKVDNDAIPADDLFAELDKQFTQAGALLKGLRYRENVTQKEFAKKIDISQSDLSKMENGKLPIGKTIAKRIEAAFGVNYRHFLE